MRRRMTAETIVNRLADAIADGGVVALHEPDLGAREEELTSDCVRSGWVSSVGAYVDRFERMLAEYTGAARAIAMVNGTAALHLALHLAGVERDDEVITQALTFIATANAIHACGAVPHFADVSPTTLGLDPAALDAHLAEIGEPLPGGGLRNRLTGRRIRAMVPMHTFGHPVALEALAELCDRHGLALVEDAAESLGSLYHGRHTGRWGRVAALSFNGNKIITTGGGGALLFENQNLADRAKHLSTTAKLPHPWAFQHDEAGFNYRLPNLNAALGCAQMERLDGFLEAKRELANLYQTLFADCPGVSVFCEPENARSNYWLNTLLLDQPDEVLRDTILAALHERRILVRPAWGLMPDQVPYADAPSAPLPVSRDLAARIICLPSSPALVSRLRAATSAEH